MDTYPHNINDRVDFNQVLSQIDSYLGACIFQMSVLSESQLIGDAQAFYELAAQLTQVRHSLYAYYDLAPGETVDTL